MAPRPPASTSSSATVSSFVAVPKPWLVGLLALVVVPWLVVGWIYFQPQTGEARSTPVGGPPPTGPERAAATGPWGHLSLTPIVISPPLEYVPADWGRNAPPEWAFPGANPQMVTSFLSSVGLSPEQITVLSQRARPDSRIQGVVIAPPADLIRGLSPDVRAKLYTELSKTTVNFDQAQSFRFFGQSTTDWFDGTMMSADTRRLVEPLIYKDGDFLHFADAEAVRPLISQPDERQYLAKALLRNSTVLVRLSIDAPEEIDGLANYWGIGGRRTDIRPLLESISAANDNRLIDIVHLLPALARNHLYR